MNTAPDQYRHPDSEAPQSGIRNTRNKFQGIFAPRAKEGLEGTRYRYSTEARDRMRRRFRR